MTSGAIHAALVMRADLPILPAKTRITVAASAQVGGAIDGHGRLRVIGWSRSMAGFTGHAAFLVCCGRRIVACRVAYKTSARLALFIPLIHKGRITAGFPMRTVLPARLELSMADSAIG